MNGTISVINMRDDWPDVAASEKQTYLYVGRPSVLGNPFAMGHERDRDLVIAAYRRWLHARYKQNTNQRMYILMLVDAIKSGSDVVLGCWCHPKECHADVIAELVRNIIDCEDL